MGAWTQGSTRRWRQIRAAILDRDGHRCQLRTSPACKTIATQAHHTRPRRLVGDDPAYLIAACAPCNQAAGDPARNDPPPRPRITGF